MLISSIDSFSGFQTGLQFIICWSRHGPFGTIESETVVFLP